MSHTSPRALHASHASPRVSRFLCVLVASSAVLAIAVGVVACEDTFSNPLPLYDASSDDGNGLPVQTVDSGNGGSEDASEGDAGDVGDAAKGADAGDAGDATIDGSEASDSGDASPLDGSDAASDADAG